MDTFLETYNMPRLTQKEAKDLNRSITTNELESVTEKLPTKALDHMASQVNLTKRSAKK